MDYKIIQHLASTGRHQECLEACKQLLNNEPEKPSLWKIAGKSLLSMERLEEAQNYLTKAHQLDSNDPEIAKDIGNVALGLGKNSSASIWYKKALDIDASYAPAINNLANLKRQSGKSEEAICLFKQAIEIDPQLMQAYMGASICLLNTDDLDEAKKYASQALQINHLNPGFNELLGSICQKKGNTQKAIDHYNAELKINPNAINSLQQKGLLLLQQGELKAALESLEIAEDLGQSRGFTLLLAETYQKLQQFDRAIIKYRRVSKGEQEDKIIIYRIGICLLKNNNTEESIREFKRVIDLDETFADAWAHLGISLFKEGRHQEALIATQKSHELDPTNTISLINLGAIYREIGDLDKALASTLKYIELKPDDSIAYRSLGMIYKYLGNSEQALASTLRSIELNPDDPYALVNLGGIYKELGNTGQALTSILKSLELKHDNPTAHRILGGIYKDHGELEKALASTLKSLRLEPDNHVTHTCLGMIYKDLGKLEQALTSTLQSLKLKPGDPEALSVLGIIKLAIGDFKEARKDLYESIKNDPQEYIAYYILSKILKTKEEAFELIKKIKSAIVQNTTAHDSALINFAISNCLHKAKCYKESSMHLKSANKNKLIIFPSNATSLKKAIDRSLTPCTSEKTSADKRNDGKERIFIVGMPRSGSTLLETVLSMNPEIKALGESTSLEKAINKVKRQKIGSNCQDVYELYSQINPIDKGKYKYTTDKQLYNYIYMNYIVHYMPGAKVIHCQRHAADNILSMHRSNLGAGNNYTSNLEDAARILIAQDRAMQIHKKRNPNRIFTFDYDNFVVEPEVSLGKLLKWLGLEFRNSYLRPEESSRSINTYSFMQARQPISKKSIGGWKNYKDLLEPALKILEENGLI